MLSKIFQRIELMRRVKIFVVLSVRSFYLSVMTWRVRFYQLMLYTILFQMLFKERGPAFFRSKPVCKFRPVVRLDAFHTETEEFQHVLQEYRRAVCAVLLKRLDIAETAVLVYRRILIKPFPFRSSDETRFRHKFDVGLYIMDTLPAHTVWGRIFLWIRQW